MSVPRSVNVTLGDTAIKTLTWVLQDAVASSAERVPGLSGDDARTEVEGLSSLVWILREAGAAVDARVVAGLDATLSGLAADIAARPATARP